MTRGSRWQLLLSHHPVALTVIALVDTLSRGSGVTCLEGKGRDRNNNIGHRLFLFLLDRPWLFHIGRKFSRPKTCIHLFH